MTSTATDLSVGKILTAMRDRDLVSSMAQFSRDYLSMAEDHFQSHYNRVSLKTKIRLWVKLEEIGPADLADQARSLVIEGAK